MSNKNRKVINRRNSKGQGLVESACGLIVVSMFFISIVAFGMNAYTAAVYGAKLQVVANETARVLDDNRLWLGVQRPDYNAQQSHERAEVIGKKVAQILSIPGEVTFAFEEISQSEGIISKVTASVGFIKLPFGFGIFPVGIPFSSTSASARGLSQPYAVLHFDAAISKDGVVRDGVSLPAYGFFRKYQSAGVPGVFQPAANIGGLGGPGNINPVNFRGLPLSSAAQVQNGEPAGIWHPDGVGQGEKKAIF